MKTKLVYVVVALMMVLSLAAAVVPAQLAVAAATLQVGPGQPYTTIQAAINAASTGDTIVVNNGTYNEQVLINKRITLISANGSAVTTINSSGLTGRKWEWNIGDGYTITFYPAVQIQTSGTILGTAGKGFTITGANILSWFDEEEAYTGMPQTIGTGILDIGAGCRIESNSISANSVGLWSMYFYGASNTTIAINTFSTNILALQLMGGNDSVQSNIFVDNFMTMAIEGSGNSGTPSRIINNTLLRNGQGIELHSSWNYNVSGNNIADTHAITDSESGFTTGGEAIKIDYDSRANTVFNNTISKGQAGLWAEMGIHMQNGASNNNISSNKVSGCGTGIQIDSSSNNNAVSNNEVYNCSTNGIVISGSSTNNNVAANKVHDCPDGIGIWVLDSYNNFVASNTLDKCSQGIESQNSNNIVVEKNTATNCAVGIRLQNSNNIVVEKNIATNGTVTGILLDNANSNTVRSNNVSLISKAGIYLSNSDNNQISANKINNNSIGIRISGGSNWNDISGNDIRSNGAGNGISIFDDASGTNIRCNNIAGNTEWGVWNNDNSDGINAQNNWWGDASGPGGAGPGSGDKVSGWIDFSNWAKSAFTFPYVTGPTINAAFATADTISLFDTDYLSWAMQDAPYSLGPSSTYLIVDTGCDPCNAQTVTVNLSALILGLLPADIGNTVAQWKNDAPWRYNNWQNWMNQLANQSMYQGSCNGQCYWRYSIYLDNYLNQLSGYFNYDGSDFTKMIFEKFRPGEFDLPVTAYDCSGNKALSSIKLAVVDFQLPLEKGWNIRSTPISTSSTWKSIREMGKDMVLDTVILTWDANTGTWIQPGAGDKASPLQAYYIYTSQRDQMGFIIERDKTAPPSKQLYKGWNLVSLAPYARSFDGMSTDTALSTINKVGGDLQGWSAIVSMEQGLQYQEYFKYNNCNWGSYGKNFQQAGWITVPSDKAQWMTPGGGYWVFMTNPGILGGFSYTPLPDDNTPPQLDGLNFTPTSINTTVSDDYITCTVNLSDSESGIAYAWLYFSSPSGSSSYGYGFGSYDRISGDANSGVYQRTITFSMGSESGTWHIDFLQIQDTAGNWESYSTDDLINMGFPVELNVTGSGGGGSPTPTPTPTPS